MLDYIALGILAFTAVSLLFAAIVMVGIPARVAAERNHPHQDAIYLAGWISLFTLHAIWPLLWIWSAAWREDPYPKFSHIDEDTAINDKTQQDSTAADDDITDSVTLLRHKYDVLDDRIERIEKAIQAATDAA